MDASSKKKKDLPSTTEASTPATTAEDTSTDRKPGPVHSFRESDISVSIWLREYNSRHYLSCSFERSYKDSHGQWRYSRYFGLDDLGKVVALAQKASEYIRGFQEPEGQK